MNRFCTERRPILRPGYAILAALLAMLILGMSGCAGSVHATSWTGMALAGDRLYLADLEQVVAMNPSDASVVWAFPTHPKDDPRGIFYVTPAVSENYVFVASDLPPTGMFSQAKHVIWALNRESGALLWSFGEAAGSYVEGGAVGDGIFVIGNSDGHVYALDAESGALKWKFTAGHRVWATPLIIGETVYIGSMDRHLYALDLFSGAKKWDFHTTGAFAAQPAMWNDTLFIGAFDDRFYAVDARTGREQWHFAGPNWFWSSPAVRETSSGEAVVYAADVSGSVYALDARNGAQIWKQALAEPTRSGLALSEDGKRLFVGTKSGTFYSLDTADGFVVWSQKSEGEILSTPVVSGNVVYVQVTYGPQRVRAFYTENGREVWSYPPATAEQK